MTKNGFELLIVMFKSYLVKSQLSFRVDTGCLWVKNGQRNIKVADHSVNPKNIHSSGHLEPQILWTLQEVQHAVHISGFMGSSRATWRLEMMKLDNQRVTHVGFLHEHLYIRSQYSHHTNN